jgi:hypothetical protein
MLKKILFPILGLLITIFLMQLSYELFITLVKSKNPCAEGCSGTFKIFLMFYTGFWFITGTVMGYLFAVNRITYKGISLLIFIFLITSFAVNWYASTYGYGLNLSY